MDWLWILLRYLFPTDPVRQAAEAARQCIANLVAEFFAPETLAILAEDDSARAYIEAIINDYEACVHLAIGARACQIAGVRFRGAARPFHPPAHPKSVARIRALVTLCNNIERLAQLRAIKLKREHDADPLGLAVHGSTDAWPRPPSPKAGEVDCAPLRARRRGLAATRPAPEPHPSSMSTNFRKPPQKPSF